MMTGDELGTAMRMAWGTETSTGRTVRDADGADFTLLSEVGYGHSATTRFSKSCCNSTGKNTHYFHCSLTSKSCMTCKTDFLTQLMEKEFLPVFLLCKNVSCAIYWLQAMLHSLQEHNAVLFLPFVPKPPSQTLGKSQTSSTGSQVATLLGIHLAHFSYSLNFKVRVFSLWLLLWDNLKMHSFSLTFPGSELSQHPWRAVLSRRKVMCLVFLSCLWNFFPFGPQRVLQESSDVLLFLTSPVEYSSGDGFYLNDQQGE